MSDHPQESALPETIEEGEEYSDSPEEEEEDLRNSLGASNGGSSSSRNLVATNKRSRHRRHSEEFQSESLAPPRRHVSGQESSHTSSSDSSSAKPPTRVPSTGSSGLSYPHTSSSDGFHSARPPTRTPSTGGSLPASPSFSRPARIPTGIPTSRLSRGPSATLRPAAGRPTQRHSPAARGTQASTSRGVLPTGPSTIQGVRTVRLSVLPVASIYESSRGDRSIRSADKELSFTPKRLLDIERGESILVTNEKFLPPTRYQELDESGALVVAARGSAQGQPDASFFELQANSLQDRITAGDIRSLESSTEVGVIGGAWRGALKRLIVWAYDEVNALRLSRALQIFLPFQTGYEAYVIGQIIEALDVGRVKDVRYALTVGFKNRNVSRILVQQMGPRYDFLWHWSTMVTHNRLFDGWGQVPLLGITAFPASENFPSTRDHALASIFRVVLGEGNWLTRVFTRGREGIVTDNPDATAQNLAAESNGFELANRNQFGTYVGRRKTNEFRFAHRLPTDESIVRTFVAQPMPTMLNNGVVHLLRQLAKHWHNMLTQFSGNFAHQRMEQLDPFETLRFHMPVVLLTLSTLRGRNKWDSKVLGPMIRKLQDLKPSSNADSARLLARELQENIVVNVSGGVAAIVDPFYDWLGAILQACDVIEDEAQKVYELITSVEIGIRLGHDLITQVGWKIPKDAALKKAILKHIDGGSTEDVSKSRIHAALNLIPPRDKRTLIELVKNGHLKNKPAQLLLGRAKTLLQRELRREYTSLAIRELSKGDYVTEVAHGEWYWLEEHDQEDVYIYDAKATGKDKHRLIHADSGSARFVSLSDGYIKTRLYVPVAEAVSRAQRAFMNIELDHGKKFTYNAFMEFSFLRLPLRRLVVISQMMCDELDNARLNLLAEIQRTPQAQVSIRELVPGKTYYKYDSEKKEYNPFVCQKQYTAADPEWEELGRTKIVNVPPQSMIVIGGGPTGLMTTIHCTETVLASGGVMKLYEARDAFAKGGSTFERAQIVRLDARWIAMLRYHLGTGFEDVYIPASGETDPQLGNTLPSQGFVEITIKDLENMLHVEVSKMWSKGLIQVHTDSKAQYDHETNSLTKLGANLKIDDRILRRVDENGNISRGRHSWRVVDILRTTALNVSDLVLGEEYGVYIREREDALVPFTLTGIDLVSQSYTFTPQDGGDSFSVKSSSLPAIYSKAALQHDQVEKIVVESVKIGRTRGYIREELELEKISKQKFTMDIGHTHVVEAIGKPHGSKVHFSVTTYEPYGVCCIQGLKISMGMHNFGEKRWGAGILDDIRSSTDQNTRIIGDFTKMVRSAPVASKMLEYITDERDPNWQVHFNKLVEESGFAELNAIDPIVPKIQEACRWLADNAPTFRRKTLQTRFFETGDNYYLGMEFTREYDRWKTELAANLVAPLMQKAKHSGAETKGIKKLEGVLMHHIDRLWYDGVLEIIRQGDVYNPGARRRVPRLYLINSYTDTNLGGLPVGESFRLSADPKEKYEILIKHSAQVIVRNVEGYISKMSKSTNVKREGNLTRSPDGNSESRVSLATFPVGHYVNFRTIRLNDSDKGYVFAFIGDEQATPHFMRYSGLTGACINSMLFNNFIKQAVDGVPFIDRFRLYSIETNWSNGEVVQRGTGANYGEDGFLRPGFPYAHGIDYLHSKVIEYRETGQDLNNILSRDWKVKLAASFVPRGMELNGAFINALYSQLQVAIFDKFVKEVRADPLIGSDSLVNLLKARAEDLEDLEYLGSISDYRNYWDEFVKGLNIDETTKGRLEDPHVLIAMHLQQMCEQVISFSEGAHHRNERISSELFNQPKSVDSIVDDFAVEAQNFANSLTMSAAFAAGALAFRLAGERVGDVVSAILAGFNILIAFGTMTNSARYKIRNEEARVIFADEKMSGVLKGVYGVMDRMTQDSIPLDINPFVISLDEQVGVFLKNSSYYDQPEPKEFKAAYAKLKSNINEPQAIRLFQNLLVTKFIVDTYHVSSYLQEYLVNIYKTLDKMHRLLVEDVDRSKDALSLKGLFDRLTLFGPKLDVSLQRGATRFGFVKRRRLSQWDAVVVFKYFWRLTFSCFPTLIATETLGIVKQTRRVSERHQPQILGREIRDLESLYWASTESDIGSLIFMTGFLVFIASILFTIARIFDINTLEDVAFWATLASSFGAILATVHLWRKLLILMGLFRILGRKVHEGETTDDRDNIRKVRRVTFTQIVLTLMRLGAAGAAAVALPWSVVQNQWGSEIGVSNMIPVWVALGSISTAIAATILFFVVEYQVRYNLSPKLGEFVCESFRGEIEETYNRLALPLNSIDTKQVQERETWEYVAREFLHKYRFDAVFAADRFGSILQYIQSGMDPR